jgi:hypothetical protein
MPLINIFLENDAPNVTIRNGEARRKTWNSEAIVEKPINTPSVSEQMAKFTTNFIQPQWKELDGTPKRDLGVMFSVNKKILQKIIEQADCEGIRIFLTANDTSNHVVIKPIDATLQELDAVFPDRAIRIMENPTKCPLEKICPSMTNDDFIKIVKTNPNIE